MTISAIVVVLRDVEDLSIEEICEITGAARWHREVAPAPRARRAAQEALTSCRRTRHERRPDAEDLIIVEVSDFLDGTLERPREATRSRTRSPTTPSTSASTTRWSRLARRSRACRRRALPSTFAHDVTSTIHKRSAGRFFARRTFGDRVPFSALLVIAVLGLCAIAYLLWASETGSLKPNPDHARRATQSGARSQRRATARATRRTA